MSLRSWQVVTLLAATLTMGLMAWLQVAAARRGRHLQLHGCDGGLAELIAFVGLSDVVGPCSCCSRAIS